MRVVITFQLLEEKARAKASLAYIDLIAMAFGSALALGYETVMVSNSILPATHKIDFPAEREPHLMNWILAAQLAYIESDLFDQPSVLFSPDALILRPLEPVFNEHDFDVAFTDRDNKKWPINNGVIYLMPRHKKALAALWRDALAVCKAYPLDVQEWYGDQQSLHDVVTAGRPEIHGLKYELLPCKTFNATPDDHAGEYDHSLLKRAFIAHFKGKRKNQMATYWKYLCSQTQSN
jgi:hypothetical protein